MNTQSSHHLPKINCPYICHNHRKPDSLYPPCMHYNERLRRDLMLLWSFLMAEDMWDDAFEYISDHTEDPLPFPRLPLFPGL